MPFGYGVGDHQAFIMDIPLESLVGTNPVKLSAQKAVNSIARFLDAGRHISTVLSPTLFGTVSWNAFMKHTAEDF